MYGLRRTFYHLPRETRRYVVHGQALEPIVSLQRLKSVSGRKLRVEAQRPAPPSELHIEPLSC